MQNLTLPSNVPMRLASFLPESCRFWEPHPQGTPPRGQIILWDASRGHFAWHLLWGAGGIPVMLPKSGFDMLMIGNWCNWCMLVGFSDVSSCFNCVLLGTLYLLRISQKNNQRRSCYLLMHWSEVTKADVVGDYKANSFSEVWWQIDRQSEMLMPSRWHLWLCLCSFVYLLLCVSLVWFSSCLVVVAVVDVAVVVVVVVIAVNVVNVDVVDDVVVVVVVLLI